MSDHAPKKGGNDTWGGGNIAWECLLWFCGPTKGAAGLAAGMVTFMFTWILDNGWGGGGWHASHAPH